MAISARSIRAAPTAAAEGGPDFLAFRLGSDFEIAHYEQGPCRVVRMAFRSGFGSSALSCLLLEMQRSCGTALRHVRDLVGACRFGVHPTRRPGSNKP